MQKSKTRNSLTKILTSMLLIALVFLSTFAVKPMTASATNVEQQTVSTYNVDETETETMLPGETTENDNVETETPGDSTGEEATEPEEPKLPTIWDASNNEYATGAYADAIPDNAVQVVRGNKYDDIRNYTWYIDFSKGGTLNIEHKVAPDDGKTFLMAGWVENKYHYIYFFNTNEGGGKLTDFSMSTYGGPYEPMLESCIVKLEFSHKAPAEIFSVLGTAKVYTVDKPAQPEPDTPEVEDISFWDNVWNWIKGAAVTVWNWCAAHPDWVCVIAAGVVFLIVIIVILIKRR